MKYYYLVLWLLITCLCGVAYSAENPLESTIDSTLEINKQASDSQTEIDRLSDSTRDMLQEYRTTLRQNDSLKTYNEQLEKLITAQQAELVSIEKQLSGVDETQRNIVPLILRMTSVLQEFIQLDMPFLREERVARLENLRQMLDRPDVSLPDKYRRIMEAYLVEMSYGRTIQAENDSIVVDNRNFSVKLLRIGRLALLYQTLNGETCGYWDKQAGIWKELPDEYNNAISKGFLIADKQSPPDFFNIPVLAPVHKQ